MRGCAEEHLVFEKLKKGLSETIEKLTKTELKGEKLDSVLWEFKIILLENDVALSAADHICEELKEKVQGIKVTRFNNPREQMDSILLNILIETLKNREEVDFLSLASKKKELKEPSIILFVGINGTGKTTTIAKVGKYLKDNGYSVIFACSDTYRTGSIEQLEEHARRLGIQTIKHQYGSDAAAVAYDAVTHAKARGINSVLIDTAGRMETNKNLMDELSKVKRVITPDLTILIVDALTGNAAVDQAEEFNKIIGIDATILTKIDADAKGGACLSVTYVTNKPIIFIGNGQRYEDLQKFEAEKFARMLLSK
jgi:fused signal recognition particle receptor